MCLLLLAFYLSAVLDHSLTTPPPNVLFFTDPVGLQEVQDFIGRIQFYQYLGKHKNLVQLEGCCTERLPLYMMLEDVVPGDLLSFLWTCRRVCTREATLVRKSFG